jgi:hypothetical protein
VTAASDSAKVKMGEKMKSAGDKMKAAGEKMKP